MTNDSSTLILFLVTSSLAVVGCSKSETAKSDNAAPPVVEKKVVDMPAAPPTAAAPAAPAAPAAEPAKPADGAMASTKKPSQWPGCAAQGVDQETLAKVPADAQGVVRDVNDAIVTNDGAKLAALFAADVKIGGKKVAKDAAMKQAIELGAEKLTKFVPNTFEDAGGKHCEWELLQAETIKSNRFGLFMGSGYGKTPTVVIDKVDSAWRVVALQVNDNGAP